MENLHLFKQQQLNKNLGLVSGINVVGSRACIIGGSLDRRRRYSRNRHERDYRARSQNDSQYCDRENITASKLLPLQQSHCQCANCYMNHTEV